MAMNFGMGGLAANPLASPEARENPHPFYAMARQAMPLLYLEQQGLWNAFLYEDCRTILRDARRFSSDFSRRLPPDDPRRERPGMLNSDPPRHTQLRDLVNKAFTPRMIAQLEPRIREIAGDLLDAVMPAGRIDLVNDLSYPLPVIVIAEILGVPAADRANFKRWSSEIVASLGAGVSMDASTVPMQTIEELRAYFTAIIEQRRAEPREDLISALIAAEIDGQHLDVQELLNFCILLLVAGNETTTNLIGNAVRCLLEHPESFDRLRAQPELWQPAIEEVLRFRSPVQATVRTATEDVELRGKTIRAGQAIVVWLASANRDPAEFPDPDRFDVTRQPNRHLAFGLGIHFCLGAPLARLEAKLVLEAVGRRLPNLRRLDGGKLDPVPGFIMHGVRSLPLVFDVDKVPA